MATTRDLSASQASSRGYQLTIAEPANAENTLTWATCALSLALVAPAGSSPLDSPYKLTRAEQAGAFALPAYRSCPSTGGLQPMLSTLMSRENVGDAGLTEEQFRDTVAEWLRQVGPTSSLKQIISYPAYRRIVQMGPDAVPFLLRELEREPSLLFCALQEITGENPVPTAARGKLREIAKAWVEWGREHEKKQ
jgi:hypothetical protein